jgi:isochorismate synthase
VSSAAGAIRRGRAEKIVLARAVRCEWREPLAPWAALRRLRQTYPGCTLFAVAEGPEAFLGATPERLVRLQRREVRVDCLAGTIGRGGTDAEDRQLAERMLTSAKDRSEHAVVVRELREKLTDLCSDLRLPPTPAVMKLRNVQHLHTPIRGRLATDDCILSLVERLHPSPAVGGFPTEAALRFIREREGLDRGWYAAPVGWLDRHGEGEFAVAIRSALLGERGATLFAGCGIMADSDPEAEYRESDLKLQSMLSALGGAGA